MGRSTYTDVVPCVAHGVWEASSGNVGNGGNIFAPARYCYLSAEEDGYEKFNPEINGWKFYSADELYEVDGYPNLDDCEMIGKRERIYASDHWLKGDNKVYIINESEYQNVDEYYISLVADNKETIEQFYNEVVAKTLQDVTLPELYEIDTVQQTL